MLQNVKYANCMLSECSHLRLELPDLPASSVCHIASTCTAIDCCIDIDYLRRSIQSSFSIDFCNFTIQGNLEKLKFNFNIIDYKWGKLYVIFLSNISIRLKCGIKTYSALNYKGYI